MTPFTTLVSRVVVLPMNDIDTDQIIPARFLTGTGREGLGKHLFQDLRSSGDGRERQEFPLNRPSAKGAQILLAGRNFGCGSSREHAAWALAEYGFRAVLSVSFADIFAANAVKNGLLPATIAQETHTQLTHALAEKSAMEATIDLTRMEVRWAGSVKPFSIDSFARECLLRGVDELGYILRFRDSIAAYETRTEKAGIP